MTFSSPTSIAQPDFEAIKNDTYALALREEINVLVEKVADLKAAYAVMQASRDHVMKREAAIRAELEALQKKMTVPSPSAPCAMSPCGVAETANGTLSPV